MTSRRPLPRWLLVSAFTVTAVGLQLGHQALHSAVALPHTITELTELLRRSGSPLHVVAMTDRSLEDGVYLCLRPQRRQQLQWLRRAPEYGGHWQGVVYCERHGSLGDLTVDRWGEYGMEIGPFVFFGDPVLLQGIQKAVQDR
jgi:hypothetical protein